MSNIAGKSYAMNVITPINRWRVLYNKAVFFLARTPLMAGALKGLKTLSLIHYARWVVVTPNQFPRLSEEQPKEKLKYAYMLFFSNFNGSWKQYVDSFHMAIPGGLDLIWNKNIKYPKSVPLQPFHEYILHNQIWTEHYYNAYPLASSNDVKSAVTLKPGLLDFIENNKNAEPEAFLKNYRNFIYEMQGNLGTVARSPVVSIASEALQESVRIMADEQQQREGN